MQIYHRDVNWPFPTNAQVMPSITSISRHAEDRWDTKCAHLGTKPQADADAELIEAYFEGGKLVKLTARLSLAKDWDLVLVLACLTDGSYHVITLWPNHVEDRHSTLDRSKYIAAN